MARDERRISLRGRQRQSRQSSCDRVRADPPIQQRVIAGTGFPQGITTRAGYRYQSLPGDRHDRARYVTNVLFAGPLGRSKSALLVGSIHQSCASAVPLECRGQHWFLDLDDAREKVENCRREYNEVRPHGAIGDRTPMFLSHRPLHGAEAAITPEILIRTGLTFGMRPVV
jgi:hypothetical protein